MSRMIFVAAESPWNAIDEGVENAAGQVVAKWNKGKTLDEMKAVYPTVTLITEAAYWQQHDDHHRTAPVEIACSDYEYALECLPPIGYVSRERGESFKFGEMKAGKITTIFARRGKHYWKFDDSVSLMHHEIMQRIDRHTESLQAKEIA